MITFFICISVDYYKRLLDNCTMSSLFTAYSILSVPQGTTANDCSSIALDQAGAAASPDHELSESGEIY